MNLKEKILELYFIDKLKQKDIATKLQVSKYIVSRTVSKDSRYKIEKSRRKLESKQKNNKDTINYIKNKRNNNQIDYLYLKAQHEQASRELSQGGKTISNRAYRDWNSSAYKYDKKTKSYVLRKNITAGSDVPKRISWK